MSLKDEIHLIQGNTVTGGTIHQGDVHNNFLQDPLGPTFFRTNDYERGKNFQIKPESSTCDWILSEPLFKQWLRLDSSPFLHYIAPECCGKSVLAQYLIDTIRIRYPKRRVLYFFFDKSVSDSTASALCAILHQLFRKRPALFRRYAIPVIRDQGENLLEHTDSLWQIFIRAAEDPDAGRIVCIFDAIDHHNGKSQHLMSFFDGWRAVATKFSTRVLFTSRPGWNPTLGPSPTWLRLRASQQNIHGILRKIIKATIDRIVAKKSLPSNLCDDIVERIYRRCPENYLWLSAILPELEEWAVLSTPRVDKILDERSSKMSCLYAQRFEEFSEEARDVLRMLLVTPRLLTRSEWAHLILLKDRFSTYEQLRSHVHDSEQWPIDRIQSICGVFVGYSNGFINISHNSIREFLENSHSDHIPNATREPPLNIREAHGDMFARCAHYIELVEHDYAKNRKILRPGYDLQRQDESDLKDKYPLLHYAATLWSTHYQRSILNDEDAIAKAEQLCRVDDLNAPPAWFFVLDENIRVHARTLALWSKQSPLPRQEEECYIVDEPDGEGNVSEDGEDSVSDWYESLDDGSGSTDSEPEDRLIYLDGIDNCYRDDNEDITHCTDYDESDSYYTEYDEEDTRYQDSDHESMSPTTSNDRNSASEVFIHEANGHPCNNAEKLQLHPMSARVLTVLWAAIRNLTVVLERVFDADLLRIRGATWYLGLALSIAAENGHLECVDFLTQRDISPNWSCDPRESPLGFAAKAQDTRILQMLLARGALVNKTFGHGECALHSAILSRNHNAVHALIMHGADVNLQGCIGRTALHEACSIGHSGIIDEIMRARPNVEIHCRYGTTALHYAATHNDTSIIKKLIDAGIDRNKHNNEDGMTALHVAAHHGNTEVVNFLIQQDSAINESDCRGSLPLHEASRQGHVSTVSSLLGAGADLAKLTDDGETALHLAVYAKNVELVEVLLKAGVSLTTFDKSGRNALHRAIQLRNLKITKLLLAWEPSTSPSQLGVTHGPGNMALHYAVAADNGTAVAIYTQLMLSYGADVNACNRHRQTPLALAALLGSTSAMKELLQKGASANSRDKNCETALHVAAASQCVEAVNLLVEADANVMARDRAGQCALWKAVQADDIEVVELLAPLSLAEEIVVRNAGSRGVRSILRARVKEQHGGCKKISSEASTVGTGDLSDST